MNKEHITLAATAFFQFLTHLVLGVLVAVFFVLPWLLRFISIIAWLVSLFICIQTIEMIYSPFSDEVPLFALQFGVVLIMIQWAMVGLHMYEGRRFWGILVAGAATLWGVSNGMSWLSSNWKYADLLFRILPPALLAVSMISFGIRARARRSSTHQAPQPSPLIHSTEGSQIKLSPITGVGIRKA